MISPLANYYGDFLSENSNSLDNKLNIENSFFDKLTEDDEARFSVILSKLEQDENDGNDGNIGIQEKEEIFNILHKKISKVKVITLPQTDVKINLKIPIRPKNPFYKNFEYN
jgi:hypothetical protein